MPFPRLAPALVVLAAALALPSTSPAARRNHACHGRNVAIRVGHHRACVAASAPRSTAAQQRAVDRALLATRLKPRRGRRSRTLRAWIGPARKGFAAAERALAAHTSRAWRTTTTPDPTGDALEIVTSHGRAKLALDTKDTIKLEHCPDATGSVPGTRTRSVSLKLTVPLAHGRTLTVTNRQTASAPFTGTTDDTAALARVAVGRLKLKASAKGELRDAAGHVLARLPKVAATATARLPALGPDAAWPDVLTDPSTAFVASRALSDLIRHGTSSLDPLLRAFVVSMQSDAWHTYDLARAALRDEQATWWQGGRCVRVDLYVPGDVRIPAGGHADARATVLLAAPQAHPRHAGTAPFQLTAGATAGTVLPATAGTAAQDARNQSDPVTFGYTAPSDAGIFQVRVTAVSRQGIGSGSVPITVAPVTAPHLQVTAVGGSYDETYHAVDNGPNCSHDSQEHYGLTAPATPDHPWEVGDLSTILVSFHQHGTSTGSITCPPPGLDNVSCNRTIDDDGSYYLDITHAAGAAEATLGFLALRPYYADCAQLVKDGGETTVVTHPKLETTIPWSQITGTQAFSVHVHGSFSDSSHQVTRDYTLTLQPVDADGHALG